MARFTFFAATTTALALASLAAIPAPVRAATFQVTVGGPGVLRYDPQFVNASTGDQIVFTFKQKNHTVTQSTFDSPCSPAPDGFDSGFMPVADGVVDGFPTRTLTVADSNPIWIYCRQTGHCQQGMVFAVNSGDRFAAFQAAANASGSTTTSPPASTTAGVATTTPSVVTVTETLAVSDGSVVTTTYGSYPGSAQPTAAAPQVHQVTVGGSAGLVYTPSNITAQPGDQIVFTFQVKNHTVTQSSFAQPCRALTLTSTSGQVGFDSGFMPISANATQFPTFTITVNDTAPIWAYCKQSGHCGQGMVFSVNAIESGPNNFAAFRARAMQLNGTSATSTATATATGSSSTSGALPVRIGSGMQALLGTVVLVFGLLL